MTDPKLGNYLKFLFAISFLKWFSFRIMCKSGDDLSPIHEIHKSYALRKTIYLTNSGPTLCDKFVKVG